MPPNIYKSHRMPDSSICLKVNFLYRELDSYLYEKYKFLNRK